MRIKGLIAEDFCNYKKPSMFIISAVCNWKCCNEQGLDISICQNSSLAQQQVEDVNNNSIYSSYINNPISKAIVIGGLEPMLQIDELVDLIGCFRSNGCYDEFVIYTGYYKDEIVEELNKLRQFDNIIVKFGRFIPNRQSRYDEILGINLVSDNQYAEVVS